MKKLVLVALVCVLAGCSVEHSLRNEIRLGTFTVMPAESSDYQYVVNIRAIKDIGYDTADPEIRMMIIKQLLGNACQNPVVHDETLLERPNQPNAYLIKVSCQ